jgi:hypothetical protein
MRAILIDVAALDLREIELPKGKRLEAMQAAVGRKIELAVQLPNGDDVFVDEEGLFKQPKTGWFTVRGAHQPFAGNGLVVGHDGRGNTIAAKISLDELRRLIGWTEPLRIGNEIVWL